MKSLIFAISFMLSVTACARKDASVVQDTAVSNAIVVVDTPTESLALNDLKRTKAAKLTEEYKNLLAEDATDSAPKSFGLAGPSACDKYGRMVDWENFQNHLVWAGQSGISIQVSTDTITAHFTAAVKNAAKTVLSIKDRISDIEGDSVTNPYLYLACDNGEESLDAIFRVMQWVRLTKINPDSAGLTAKAVRSRAAFILSTEIKRDQKDGGGRWLGCKCETSIPYYYQSFRFTKEELGLNEKEWKLFVEGPKS